MLSNCGIGEDSWEPLNSKEIKPANPKGNQLWLFTGRTDAEAPILRLPDAKSWLTVKDSNAGKDWGQEEKKPRKDEMVGWPHHLNGHGFEQTPGDSEGQGSLACCSPGVAESWTWLNDWTRQRNYRSWYASHNWRKTVTLLKPPVSQALQRICFLSLQLHINNDWKKDDLKISYNIRFPGTWQFYSPHTFFPSFTPHCNVFH